MRLAEFIYTEQNLTHYSYASYQANVLQGERDDLFLLIVVGEFDLFQNRLLGSLLHLPGHDELVEDEVSLLKVEDDVQLADGAKVFVQHFHVAVDCF